MRLKKTSVFSRSILKRPEVRSGEGSDRNVRAFLFFITLIFLSAPSFGTTLICRNNKSVRTLRSDKTASGCRAVYTKEGVDQVVGSSMRANGCDSILQTIRKTLEAHTWKCKETKSGGVSNLSQ